MKLVEHEKLFQNCTSIVGYISMQACLKKFQIHHLLCEVKYVKMLLIIIWSAKIDRSKFSGHRISSFEIE